MDALKFPIVGTFLLFTLAGLLAFYMPLPSPAASSDDLSSHLLHKYSN